MSAIQLRLRGAQFDEMIYMDLGGNIVFVSYVVFPRWSTYLFPQHAAITTTFLIFLFLYSITIFYDPVVQRQSELVKPSI